MFLAIVYLIILVAALLGMFWDHPYAARGSRFGQWLLFAIIFYHVFSIRY